MDQCNSGPEFQRECKVAYHRWDFFAELSVVPQNSDSRNLSSHWAVPVGPARPVGRKEHGLSGRLYNEEYGSAEEEEKKDNF